MTRNRKLKKDGTAKREYGEGGLYQVPNSPYWYMKTYVNGKAHVQSTRETDKKKALKKLQRISGQIENGTYAEPKKITVAELVADAITYWRDTQGKPVYATASQNKWEQHLRTFFGNMRADRVGTDQIRKYRAERMKGENPPSPTTVNRELQILRKAYKLATTATPPKVRFVPTFEMASEKGNARQTFMTPDVVDKLRTAATAEGLWARFFLEMILTVGWRKSEVLDLKVSNVHLLEGYVRLDPWETKNREAREAALNGSLKTLATAMVVGKKPDARIFPIRDVRHAWKRICEAAGVKAGKDGGYVVHDGRRTAPRRQRKAGVAQSVSMAQMGWKTDAMFRRYGIVNTDDMLDAMNRVERFEASQKAEAEAVLAATQSQNSHTDHFQALGLPTAPSGKAN